jgi:hypothetical protein
MAEALGWTPESETEAAERKAEKDDAHAEQEREQQGAQKANKVVGTQEAMVPANKAESSHQKKDGFQALNQKGKGADLGAKQNVGTPTTTAVKTTEAVREAQERVLKSGKPMNAFELLNTAQPQGVLFKEESGREGYDESKEDPELRAAVEEMIQKLFGVKGILRVGAGRNMEDEAVVVVAVGTGFGEASLNAVPERIRKFPTLLALPYDILPLKKAR